MTDAPPREDWRKKLVKLFARCSQPPCFRYPVDGADEIDRVIDAAIEARLDPILLIRNGSLSSVVTDWSPN
jgi:hypothetical protein